MPNSIQPVKVITSSDLEENGGVYLVRKGVAAVPVHGLTSQGNRAVKGRARPVYVVSEAEFNAGYFTRGRGQPMPVGDIDDLGYVGTLEGRTAIPVYAVNDWPVSGVDDYQAYIDAMEVEPSQTWLDASAQLFTDIKAALGINRLSDALDFAYILAAETEQAALLNMVNPDIHNATNVSAMAFEASRGFTGNGTTSYLNSNYNPSIDGVRYLLDNASMGFYSRTELNATGFAIDMGAVGGVNRSTKIACRIFDICLWNININTDTANVANTTSLSLFVANRSEESLMTLYRAGASIQSFSAGASVGIPGNNFYIGAFNNSGVAESFTTRQYAFAFAGGSMNATQQADFYNAVQVFMNAIGAGVTTAPAGEANVVFEPLTIADELGGVLLAQQGISPTANFGAYSGI